MPCNSKSAKYAESPYMFECNAKTNRWNKRQVDAVARDLEKCQEKNAEKRETLKLAKREMKTLYKVQKMHHELCVKAAKDKVHAQLLQRRVNALENELAAAAPPAQKKKKGPTRKRLTLPKYTAADLERMAEEVAQRNAARMDAVIERATERWQLENPGRALPVDFQDVPPPARISPAAAKALSKPVNVLVPRKKVRA